MGKQMEARNETWCDGWMVGFQAAMALKSDRSGTHRMWRRLRDEYLLKRKENTNG